MIGPILFIIALALIIYIVVVGSKKNKQDWAVLIQKGITKESLIKAETYVGGHPELDKNLTNSVIYKLENELIISDQLAPNAPPVKRCTIPIESVKNINIEDSSTIENKVTLGRAILVGVFALAWRKKKKNELAFVTIDWNDGKFEHSTIFSFEGINAMQKANTARNALIKILR